MNLISQYLLNRLANNACFQSTTTTSSEAAIVVANETTREGQDNENIDSNLNQLIYNNNLLWNSFVKAEQLKGCVGTKKEQQDQFGSIEERVEHKADLITRKVLYRDSHVVVRERQEGFGSTENKEKENNLMFVNGWDKRSSFQSTSSTESNVTSPSTFSNKLLTVKQLRKKKEETTKSSSCKTFIINTPRDISQQLEEHEALIGKRGRGRPKGKTNVIKKNKL